MKKPQLECEDIAFTIAPRLNAAGRLGQAQLAVELLITDSAERARKLAEFIHGLNEQRQSLERSVLPRRQPRGPRKLRTNAIRRRWCSPAAAGTRASSASSPAGSPKNIHRPVVLISLDELGCKPGMGSGRSIAGFNLHAALAACESHLVCHGGHEAAAGLTIHEVAIDAFRADFCDVCRPPDFAGRLRVPSCSSTPKRPSPRSRHQTVRQIESLAPFGHGNHRPVLCTSDVRLAEPPKRIGSTGRHLSVRFEQHGVSLRGVAFGGGDWEHELTNANGPLAIAFKPVINSFRGRQSVEMHLADWRRDNDR